MQRHGMWIAVVVLFGAGGLGCGGTGTTGGEDLGPTNDLGGVTASFQSLYGDYLGTCKGCHAPGAPGRTSDIEKTLDFTTQTTAYTTLTTGGAEGLTGAAMACNSVPFVVKGKPEISLALAVVDQAVRTAFDVPAYPMCDQLTITDETVKVGTPPSTAFLAAFSGWIQAGALDN